MLSDQMDKNMTVKWGAQKTVSTVERSPLWLSEPVGKRYVWACVHPLHIAVTQFSYYVRFLTSSGLFGLLSADVWPWYGLLVAQIWTSSGLFGLLCHVQERIDIMDNPLLMAGNWGLWGGMPFF